MGSESVKISTKTKSMDILFLENRLKWLVSHEEYERAAVIKRWIIELSQKQK
jgi:protein-arginine kinase activator protein McsA